MFLFQPTVTMSKWDEISPTLESDSSVLYSPAEASLQDGYQLKQLLLKSSDSDAGCSRVMPQ